MEPDVRLFVRRLCFPSLCEWTANALARLRGCAGSSDGTMLAYDTSPLSSWTSLFNWRGMFKFTIKCRRASALQKVSFKVAYFTFSLWNVYSTMKNIVLALLAHLSRRLTRWAYSIPMVRRPSVVRRLSSVVRRPSSTLSNLNISKASWPILIKFYV